MASSPAAIPAHHERTNTNLSIGSEFQAGAADEPFDIKGLLHALETTGDPIPPASILMPVHYNSPNPAVTALLRNQDGWTAACIGYFESQGWSPAELIEMHTDLVTKNGGPDERCGYLAEAAIIKKNTTAFLAIPIPNTKRQGLIAYVDAMLDVEPDCKEYGAIKAALLGQQVNKLSKVIGK